MRTPIKHILEKTTLAGLLLFLGTAGSWGQTLERPEASPAATAPAAVSVLSLANFGARGDGVTNDTRAIQRALDAAALTGARVCGSSSATYLLSAAGRVGVQVPSGSVVPQNYCLLLRSGVMLDLQGGTLKLQPGSPASYLIINADPTVAGGDHDCGVSNATLDGSGVEATGTSMLTFAHALRPMLKSVRVENGVYQGIFCFGCSFGVFDDLSAENFQGQALQFGTPSGPNNMVYDSLFGSIRAHNITSLNKTNQPGNGFLGVLQRCSIQSICATDCAAGIKLQGPGSDVSIGTVFSDTCGDSSGNSGLKFQGDPATGQYPQRMTVGQVICSHQTGTGLYLEKDVDCSVGSYTGFHNNTLGKGPDVWIGGLRDHIGSLSSLLAGGDAVLVRSSAQSYRIDSVHAGDPGQVMTATSKSGVSVQGGVGTIGALVAGDDQARPTMIHGFQNNEPTAVLTVDTITVTGSSSTPCTVKSANVKL